MAGPGMTGNPFTTDDRPGHPATPDDPFWSDRTQDLSVPERTLEFPAMPTPEQWSAAPQPMAQSSAPLTPAPSTSPQEPPPWADPYPQSPGWGQPWGALPQYPAAPPAPQYVSPVHASPQYPAQAWPAASTAPMVAVPTVYAYAPYGLDPVTGLPYSDKSKGVAALLSFFLGMFGVGRFYAGHAAIGAVQLGITLVFGWMILPLLITSAWALIDTIIFLAGNQRDGNGLPMRS